MKKTENYLKKLIQEMPEPHRELDFVGEEKGKVILFEGVPRKRERLKYTAAAACMLLLAASVPVVAQIPFITERMQAMPKEEIQDLADMTNGQAINADLFSRPLSVEERIRMEVVREDYINGIFPKEEIVMVSGEEEAAADFYYNRDTGMFFLPESRDLTDQELAQLVDFHYKRDYSLQAQVAPEDMAVPAFESVEPASDMTIPETHKTLIKDWMTALGISDLDSDVLELKEILTNIYDDRIPRYIYNYQTSDGNFKFVFDGDSVFYIERTVEAAETDNQTDVAMAKIEFLDNTESYELIKNALETMGSTLEIMDGEEFVVNSAWYYVNTDLEGNLFGGNYGYLFVCDEDKACLVFCKYGDTCPYMFIPTSPFPYLDMTEGKVFDDIVYEVIALDVDTGQIQASLGEI